MREFWKSVKRGTPMTRKMFWRWMEILGILSLIILTISAPFLTASIDNIIYQTIVWALFILLIFIFAASIGLMPYWGMREMKREVEQKLIEQNNAYEKTEPLRELEKLQNKNPNEYIFAFIDRVDASQMKQGKDYLGLSYSIISALPCDLNFVRAKCLLVINNEVTEERDISPILKKNQNNCDYRDIKLGDKISPQTKEKLQNKTGMRFKLEFECFDKDSKKLFFKTQEQEIIVIV